MHLWSIAQSETITLLCIHKTHFVKQLTELSFDKHKI